MALGYRGDTLGDRKGEFAYFLGREGDFGEGKRGGETGGDGSRVGGCVENEAVTAAIGACSVEGTVDGEWVGVGVSEEAVASG